MRYRHARVVLSNCVECRDALVADCRSLGLPLPIAEVILVPETWLSHKCPHREDGLVLKFEEDAADADAHTGTESMRWKGEEEIEAPEWRTNCDATKGIGYPAREDGSYGSHPSHDGFDDESDP